MRKRTAIGVSLTFGVIWAFRSLISFADPEFADPVDVLDWLAVLSLSAAAFLLAPAMLALGRLSETTTWWRAAAGIIAVGGLLAGAGNLLEDAVQTRAGGTFYALGLAAAFAGLVAMTFALLAEEPRVLALVPVCTIAGLITLEVGGGLLVLAAWAWVAWRLAARG
jgi:hypothetical protein